MKTIVLASSIMALSVGFAAAEVTLSGDARMGIISNFDDAATLAIDESDLQFTSRARVKFTLSGSTDGGLEFGASFRADNAGASTSVSTGLDGIAGTADDIVTVGGGAVNGSEGSVFISGAFGKLSMGDVDGAANAAVGQVSGVGLTGLGDLNELQYDNGGNFGSADPSALYEYSTGDLTFYASVTQPSATTDAYSIAAKYALGDYTVALAYEALENSLGDDFRDIYVGGTATFGAVTMKAIYGHETSNAGFDQDQFAVSVDYNADALTLTAYYTDDSNIGTVVNGFSKAYGLGAAYDLGGGASVVGGYSHNDTSNQDAYDLGVSMSF